MPPRRAALTNRARSRRPVSPLLDSREVAAYLKVSESTLSRWRTDHTGPPFLRLGGIARYRLATIDDWLESKEKPHGG